MHPPIENDQKSASWASVWLDAMLGLTKYVAASSFATSLVVWHAFSTRYQCATALPLEMLH